MQMLQYRLTKSRSSRVDGFLFFVRNVSGLAASSRRVTTMHVKGRSSFASFDDVSDLQGTFVKLESSIG